MSADRVYGETFIQIDYVPDEYIRMLGFNAVRGQCLRRKIFKVHCYDHVSPPDYGRSQDVTIIWIGEIQSTDHRLVPCDEAVFDRLVHQFPGSFKTLF